MALAYGFTITHDHLDGQAGGLIGKVSMHATESVHAALTTAPETCRRFRLKDDDGQVYYEGIFAGDHTSEDAFTPLEWATDYAGCTSIEYLQDNGQWEVL